MVAFLTLYKETSLASIWRDISKAKIAAIVILIAAASFLVIRIIAQPGPSMPPTGGGGPAEIPVAGVIEPKQRVDDTTVTRVIDYADGTWSTMPEPLPEINSLVEGAEIVLTSILEGDFDSYHTLMLGRGAVLSPRAEAMMKLRPVPEGMTPEAWEATDTMDRLRIVWADPEARSVAWDRIDLSDIRAGTGWNRSSEYVGEKHIGIFSIYDMPSGGIQLLGRANEGEIPAAWFSVPVRFNSGTVGHYRVVFLHDPTTRQWLPARLEIHGPDALQALPLI